MRVGFTPGFGLAFTGGFPRTKLVYDHSAEACLSSEGAVRYGQSRLQRRAPFHRYRNPSLQANRYDVGGPR